MEIEGQAGAQNQTTERMTLLPPVIPYSVALRDFDDLSSSIFYDLGVIF